MYKGTDLQLVPYGQVGRLAGDQRRVYNVGLWIHSPSEVLNMIKCISNEFN
jgi:hypothetical protein